MEEVNLPNKIETLNNKMSKKYNSNNDNSESKDVNDMSKKESNASLISLLEGCSESVTMNKTFESLKLKTNLLRGIFNCGYEKPTLIQQQALGQSMENKDLVVLSQSSTGKSISIAISILQNIKDSEETFIQAIVLSPTRELSQQFAASIKLLGEYITYLKVHAFVGGTSLKADIKSISEGVNVVIGTPSRILDMLNKQVLKVYCDKIKMFVIDDADEMYSRGFYDHINSITNIITNCNESCQIKTTQFIHNEKIINDCSSKGTLDLSALNMNKCCLNENEKISDLEVNHSISVKETFEKNSFESKDQNSKENTFGLKKRYQILIYSTTSPKEIYSLLKEKMIKPLQISSKSEFNSLEGLKQYYITVLPENKPELLINLYKMIEITQAFVFCNSKKTVEKVSLELVKRGFVVSSYHTEMLPHEKDKNLQNFNQGLSRVLVSTDFTGRNFDIYQVDFLINFDLPSSTSTYINRIGRTRKYGKKGIVINFVTNDDKEFMVDLQFSYGFAIEELPTGHTKFK